MNFRKDDFMIDTRIVYIGNAGNGKNYKMKEDINKLSLNDNNQIFLIDLDGNYKSQILNVQSEDLKFLPNQDIKINPFDFNLGYDETSMYLKIDFIIAFIETIINKPLTSLQKSIIDKKIRILYTPYINNLKNRNILTKINKKSPSSK